MDDSYKDTAMKRRKSLMLFFLFVAFLFVGCEDSSAEGDGPGIDFVLADIVGVWEYPNQNGVSAISIDTFTSPTTRVFVKRTDATYMTAMATGL